jgi:hypothetical protein
MAFKFNAKAAMMIKKCFFLGLLMPFVAYAGIVVPEAIRVPAGQLDKLTLHAIGDQVYSCVFQNSAYSWQAQAPDAKLLDGAGHVVGNHYSGPVWEYKKGSRVVGRVISKFNVDLGSSIPWLLVEVVEHRGVGVFSNINFINRVNTQGGLAPSSSCNANHLGSEKRVNYSADYIFYGAR